MIPLIGLWLYVGVAAAEYVWVPGQEYSFHYEGRLVSGIPELSPSFTGLQLQCTVTVQAEDAITLWLQMSNISLRRGNDSVLRDWRKTEFSMVDVSSRFRNLLHLPLKAKINNGIVKHVVVAEEDSTWSTNLKKGMLTMLQLNLRELSLIKTDVTNITEETYPDGYFFERNVETGIMGECETMYEIAILPRYMVKEYLDLTSVPDLCQDGIMHKILKTINFDNCRRRSVFNFNTFGTTSCTPGSAVCPGLWTRSAQSYYLVCQIMNNFMIQHVTSGDEVYMNLMAYETEKIMSGTTQTMSLLKTYSISNLTREPYKARTVTTLLHNWYRESSKGPKHQPFPGPYHAPLPVMSYMENGFSEEIMSGVTNKQLRKRVEELVHDIAMLAFDELEETMPVDKLLEATRIMRWLSEEDLLQLWTNLVDKDQSNVSAEPVSVRSIFLDTLTMTGTNSAVIMIMNQVMSRNIVGEEALQMVMAFPKYIREPTKELLSRFVKVYLPSETVRSDLLLEVTSVLAFSNVVRLACTERNRNSRYPEQAFGEFCNPYMSDVRNQYFAYVEQLLNNAPFDGLRAVYLFALRNFGHIDIIQVVKPYLEGEKTSNIFVRIMALDALRSIATLKPEIVFPIFSRIFTNPAEHHEMRMTAFYWIVLKNAPISYWQKAAIGTWFEPSIQITTWIYSTISSLAKSKDPVYKELSTKAAVVLPLVKPVVVGAQYSQNYYFSQFMDKMKLGCLQNVGWFNNMDAMLPSVTYYYHHCTMGGVLLHLFEMATVSHNFGSLLEQFWRVFKPQGTSGHTQQDGNCITCEFENIMRKLGIIKRPSPMPEVAMSFRLLGDMERFFAINKDSLWQIIAGVSMFLSKLQEGYHVNFQKLATIGEFSFTLPNSMGIPVVYRLNPIIFTSLKGAVQLRTTPNISSREPHLQIPEEAALDANIKLGFLGKVVSEVGFNLPFRHEFLSIGVVRSLQVFLPVKTTINLSIKKSQISVAMKPSGESLKHDLIHLLQQPFTSIRDRVPYNSVAELSTIHSPTVTVPIKKMEISLGGKFTGLKLKLHGNTDSSLSGLPLSFMAVQTQSPMFLLQYWWASPTLSFAEYTLEFDEEDLQTEEIDNIFTFGHIQQKDNPVINEETESDISDIGSRRQRSLARAVKNFVDPRAFNIDWLIRIKGVRNLCYATSVTYVEDSMGFRQKLSITVETSSTPSIHRRTYKMCLDGELTSPQLSTLDRVSFSMKSFTTHMKVDMLFGKSCKHHHTAITGTMRKTEGLATKSYISREHRAYQEARSFEVSRSLADKEILALLDEYYFQFSTGELPHHLRHIATNFEEILKYFFYPHVTQKNREVFNTNVSLVGRFNQERNTMDWVLHKATTDISFRNLRIPPFARVFFPLSAVKSISDRIFDTFTGGHNWHTCHLENDDVTTFDNYFYSYRLNICDHVIMMDCSGKSRVAVLAKTVSGRKVVTLLLEDKKIEIIPEEVSLTSAKLHVKVNGIQQKISKYRRVDVEAANKVLAEIRKMEDEIIQVYDIIHNVKIVTDSKTLVLHVYNYFYRNKLCGLCGDFNGEQMAEMKSPEMCIMTHPDLFGYSYMLQDEACNGASPSKIIQLKSDASNCTKNHVISTKLSTSDKLHSSFCMLSRHVVIDRENERCFSKYMYTTCSSPCKPSKMKLEEIEFHCMMFGSLADQLEIDARNSALGELQDKEINFRISIAIPVSCKNTLLS